MIQEMEILHLRFLKHILCVHKNTCNDIVYGETGTYPLNIDIKVKVLCYWIRPITGRREKLANVSYQCLFHLDAAHLYTSPWLKEVKCTLNNFGLSDVWLQQEVFNPVWLRKTIEQRLRDQWITQWYSNISLKSVYMTHVTFKNCYGMEEYLTKLRTKLRIVLGKLRTNNNRLPVIAGRYQNVPREERL